jgi:hypothetical protein
MVPVSEPRLKTDPCNRAPFHENAAVEALAKSLTAVGDGGEKAAKTA